MSDYIVQGVPYVAQGDERTCWEAAYKMLLLYAGKSPDIVSSMPNYKEVCENGMRDAYLLPCRHFMGLSSTRSSYLSDAAAIEDVLRRYGPIWCDGRFWFKAGWHVVVLVGVETSVFGDKVLVNDPYSGYMSRTMREPRSWGIDYFTSHVNPHDFSCQHWA